MDYGVVWFKRDFRVVDHAALAAAARRGPVLPCAWSSPRCGHSPMRQPSTTTSCSKARASCMPNCAASAGRLHLVVGDMPAVLDRLQALAPFSTLYSHEETGNGASYARDRAVARWCREHGVRWHEFPQFSGVVRQLADRDRWQPAWRHMSAHRRSAARARLRPLPWPAERAPAAASLGLPAVEPALRQRGGREAALACLHDFLDVRSGQYRGGISSPLSAPTACSRLSPYLAWGQLSLREVVQATRERIACVPEGDRRRAGLSAFVSRLYWHCHFIQKLESEPALEFENLHRGYDGLREHDWNPAHFEALVAGRTGWPLVDACVAMLRETGWINFRMRAMLVSVAAYPLWLHWRPVGLWLARQFLDYEPGIHWSQLQMQSGTTGINTTRVYNLIKQARDHDAQGRFVRRWLPPCAACRTPGCSNPGACHRTCRRAAACASARTSRRRRSNSSPPPARPSPACMRCAPGPRCVRPKPRSSSVTVRASDRRRAAGRPAPPGNCNSSSEEPPCMRKKSDLPTKRCACCWTPLRLAQALGEGLGRGALLLRALPSRASHGSARRGGGLKWLCAR